MQGVPFKLFIDVQYIQRSAEILSVYLDEFFSKANRDPTQRILK
jgi:hypothetical protein